MEDELDEGIVSDVQCWELQDFLLKLDDKYNLITKALSKKSECRISEWVVAGINSSVAFYLESVDNDNNAEEEPTRLVSLSFDEIIEIADRSDVDLPKNINEIISYNVFKTTCAASTKPKPFI